jgi:hypothetical protein
MQTRIVTRPAIATLVLMIVWTASPRAGSAQQCRRTCEAGETRDVRGCCVPAAKPARPEAKPERAPRRERPAREAPEAEAPVAKPSAPPAPKPNEPPASKPSDVAKTKPSDVATAKPGRKPSTAEPGELPASKPTEPPAASKPEEPQRVRRQRDPDPAPTRPAPTEPSRPVPAVRASGEQSPSTRTTPLAPAPEPPGATQRPRIGQPPGATAPGNRRTEPPDTTRTEPMVPSRPDTDRPPDVRPGMLEPPRVDLALDTPVPEQEPSRRWPVWMPWAVVGAGAVVTGVGSLLYTSASSEYDSFDKAFSERCMNSGCNESEVPDLADQLDRARTLETTSRISMIAGGVTVAAGVALVFLNQATEPTREHATARTFVVPTLGPGAAGISAVISF